MSISQCSHKNCSPLFLREFSFISFYLCDDKRLVIKFSFCISHSFVGLFALFSLTRLYFPHTKWHHHYHYYYESRVLLLFLASSYRESNQIRDPASPNQVRYEWTAGWMKTTEKNIININLFTVGSRQVTSYHLSCRIWVDETC